LGHKIKPSSNYRLIASVTFTDEKIGIILAQRRKGAEFQVMDENTIGTKLIEAAIEVHRELGPGLLESV